VKCQPLSPLVFPADYYWLPCRPGTGGRGDAQRPLLAPWSGGAGSGAGSVFVFGHRRPRRQPDDATRDVRACRVNRTTNYIKKIPVESATYSHALLA
jgi:hypothetical protein